jgi:integrase
MAHSSASARLPLQDMALRPASLSQYNKSLSSFLAFARLTYKQFLLASSASIDAALAVFIQSSYDQARPFTYAAHALHAAVFHRPALKSRVPVARQCLRGWERNRASTSHPPLTWELTVVLACTLARSGHHAVAVAMLLAFDCYLRVGELTRLRRCDIVMPHDARMGQAHTGMAVILKHTKTGKNQSVPLQSQSVADVLCLWMRRMPAGTSDRSPVFGFTPAKMRSLMRDACVALGVEHTPYVPHSLRHGGATADFLRTNSIAHVQFRGRWKSMESARNYIQTSRALLAAQRVPSRLNQLGITLSDSLLAAMTDVFDTVPAVVPRAPAGRRVGFRL